MSTETLQEFLVRVRYESDQTSQSNMLSGVTNVGAAVIKLGATILAAGTAAAYATLKYAENMNSMYLSSQRLGMGIKEINSMSAAAAELGSSVESAKSSFEAFASFQRHNPFGSIDLMKSMGADVSLEDTNDIKLKKLSDAMQRTITQRGKIAGTQLNLIQGQMLGINENDLLAMMNPDYKGLIAKHNKAQEAEKYKEAGETANKGIIAYDIAQEHIAANMSYLMLPAIETGTKVLDIFSENIDKSAKSAAGLVDAFLEATVSLRDLPSGSTILNHDTTAPPTPNSIGGVWNRIKSSVSDFLSNPLVKRQQNLINKFIDLGLSEAQAVGVVANLKAENANFDPKKAQIGGGGGYGLAQWDKERQTNYKKWNKGVSMQETPDDVATDRQLEFIKYELDTYKNNALRAMRAAGNNVIKTTEAATRLYETPKDIKGEVIRRGKIAQLMMKNRHPESLQSADNINTTINIHGVNDPKQAADIVAQNQTRIYQQQARNTAGIMR